jgi:hypothetical protein
MALGRRLELQAILEALAGVGQKVYFQPPASVQMVYPCIVYERDRLSTIFADNNPYRHLQRYQVTVIDREADSVLIPKVAALPLCVSNRHYTANGLHHDAFTLYF